jgi:predicted dehydrogenase
MTDVGGAPLRAAVIGCGTIAHDHLAFIANSPHAELVGLCDRSPALAQAACDHYVSAPIYTDITTMLAEEHPDIVHVLTPPQTHAMLVRQALAAGAHVICEKPMAGTAGETAELLDAAVVAGKVLVESRNLLFNDPVIALLETIRSGRLGEIRECDVLLQLDFLAGPFGDENLEGPGVDLPAGAVHDFLPHLAYLFETLTGAGQVRAVHGRLENLSGNRRAGFDFLDALIDAGEVRGRLRIATDVEPSAFRVTVRGTRASVETDFYNPFFRYDGPPDIGKRAPLGQVRAGFGLVGAGLANLRNKIGQHGTIHGMGRMLEAVYSAIIRGEPVPITPEQILSTARLTDRIVALGTVR